MLSSTIGDRRSEPPRAPVEDMVPRTIPSQPQTSTLRGRGEVAPPGGRSRPVVYDDVFRGSQTMPAMDERESLRSSRQYS